MNSEFKSKEKKNGNNENPYVRPEDWLTEKEEAINDYVSGLADKSGQPYKREKNGRIKDSKKRKIRKSINDDYKEALGNIEPEDYETIIAELNEFYDTHHRGKPGSSKRSLNNAFNINILLY